MTTNELTAEQKHIADHIRGGAFDVSKSVDSQVSLFNLDCLAGMVETGEVTFSDIDAVGGAVLVAAVAKTIEKYN